MCPCDAVFIYISESFIRLSWDLIYITLPYVVLVQENLLMSQIHIALRINERRVTWTSISESFIRLSWDLIYIPLPDVVGTYVV